VLTGIHMTFETIKYTDRFAAIQNILETHNHNRQRQTHRDDWQANADIALCRLNLNNRCHV
jgi:hypothetical protein